MAAWMGAGTQVWLEMPFWTQEEADSRKERNV